MTTTVAATAPMGSGVHDTPAPVLPAALDNELLRLAAEAASRITCGEAFPRSVAGRAEAAPVLRDAAAGIFGKGTRR